MKTLIVVAQAHKNEGATKKHVTGGIEKFSADVADVLDNSVLTYITTEDKAARRTKSVIHKAISDHSPDVIIMNDPNHAVYTLSFDIPTILVYHEGFFRDPRILTHGETLKRLIDRGVHLYFVSKPQEDYHRMRCVQLNGYDFGPSKGYINSSYCPDHYAPSKKRFHECVTVGRTDVTKDPFLLHRLGQPTGMETLVLTNNPVYKSDTQNAYVSKNADWKYPQDTRRNLEHQEVMKMLSHSMTYLSTCPVESWGITAMEAAAHGLPLILNSQNGAHASESIVPDAKYCRLIDKSITPQEFDLIVKEMTLPYEEAVELSEKTKELHSKARWKANLERMVDRVHSEHDQNKGLMKFFQ